MDSGPSATRASSSPSHPLDVGGFAPGRILADRYRIVALVGRGGMGEVYRADDLKLGQPVALKFLPPGLEADPAARDRLLAEVRSARTVSHPNVCRVYDVGELTGPALSERSESKGRVFLTMEYIDGEDLASLLRRIGRLPAAKALEIARQLCAGLAAAHDKGVLHRDLKPANVMIDGRGQARITDFGLAVNMQAAGSPADFAGTLAYMAPERFHGTPATVQSDLYGLGLILYETYTGKPAFKADSARDWERAHADSTPSSPSALASEIEPAVDRAIMRCLAKEPAKRPASAAQVAAALPGGDPLAAALAAGETPSPELVAASGEEGTLPRWKAWTWLAACLAMLVIVPFSFLPVSLTEHVALDLTPDTLQNKARDVLRRLGYTEQPSDRGWWFQADADDVRRLNALRPADAMERLRSAEPGPLRFCYRQSPVPLEPWRPGGQLAKDDPPLRAGDVYVELDSRGRLLALRVSPAASGVAQPSKHVDWTALFEVAGLGTPDAFALDAPQLWPEDAPDVREARYGVHAGQQVRIEAAARAGRPIFFRLMLPWRVAPSPETAPSRAQSASEASMAATEAILWICLVVLGVLARRNLKLGRGDRAGARTLAVSSGVATTVALALLSPSPMRGTVVSLPQGLFNGLWPWLFYLGFEPVIRRTWPHLLITWTRLIDGRWRDPLVGRTLLAGALVGLCYSVPASLLLYRLMGLVGGAPTHFSWVALLPGLKFTALPFLGVLPAILYSLLALGLLSILRLIVRRPGLAWAIFVVLFLGLLFMDNLGNRPDQINIWMYLGLNVLYNLMLVWVLRKHGVLALATALIVNSLMGSVAWTLDLSRWYAWRQWFAVAMVLALVVWGFRNVLGKQSAFPAAALDG